MKNRKQYLAHQWCVSVMGIAAGRLLFVGLCGSCAGGDPAEETEVSSDSEDLGTDSETGAKNDSETIADTESSLETESEIETGQYAKGISISLVEANQGAAIALMEQGFEIAPGDRNVGIIMERPLLLRAYWERGAGFRNRDILAELTLKYPDGSTDVRPITLSVAGVADPDRSDGTFTWLIEKERVVPGTTYRIALKEADPAFEGTSVPEPGAVFPDDGGADLGVVDADSVLKMTMVPFAPPGGDSVSISEADKKAVEDALLELSGVARVDVTWKDPVSQEAVYASTDEPWDALARIREEDGAGPEVYYHGLLNTASCCTGDGFDFTGLGGYAGDGTGEADVWGRTAIIMIGEEGVARAALPIIHELGHNQGRLHAPCGNALDADPNFPYPGGVIGTQGYGIISGELYSDNPDIARPYADIMGYCQPVWYSDYSFEAIRIRAATLSSWGLRREISMPRVEVLKVSVSPDGFSYHFAKSALPENVDELFTNSADFIARAVLWSGEVIELPLYETAVPDNPLRAATVFLSEEIMETSSLIEIEVNGETLFVELFS